MLSMLFHAFDDFILHNLQTFKLHTSKRFFPRFPFYLDEFLPQCCFAFYLLTNMTVDCLCLLDVAMVPSDCGNSGKLISFYTLIFVNPDGPFEINNLWF